nr:hypothetical protein [Tanacetum cinerariifolium]
MLDITRRDRVFNVDVHNHNNNTIETKPVRKNNFSPLVIKNWNSDDESEVEFEPKVKVKTVRPSIEKIKFVKPAREKVEKTDSNAILLIMKILMVNLFPLEMVKVEFLDKDIIERATTTASSLEAEQDSGNINRNQTIETLNEPLPQGTGSDSGSRRHLKLEDSDGISTLPNTKIFEQLALMRVPTPPHDSPLSGSHTPGSDEGSLTLNELTILFTPTKVSSQEDQPRDELGVLSAAKILKDATRVHTYSRRRRAVSTGIGGVSTASRIISTVEETVSTVGVSMPVSTTGMVQESTSSPRVAKDKGKAIMIEFEPKKTTTKLRQKQDRAGYEAAIRLQEQKNEEENQRIAKDAEIAQRLQEKIDRNNFFAQQRAKAKRNKPMTQAQQRTYMSNYIKHIGSYTLKQLKKLSFEEIKELFEATIRRIQDFVLIEREGDKEVSKFAGVRGSKKDPEEELDQGSSKKQKIDEASGLVKEQPVEEEKRIVIKGSSAVNDHSSRARNEC